jgi:CDP-paratose 2-epimerase
MGQQHNPLQSNFVTKKILITGGAGFIGSNLADHFIQKGHSVIIFDNLSRKGVSYNLDWLKKRHGTGFAFIQGDVRDEKAVLKAAEGIQVIYHTAGQTAVTTSMTYPRQDFETNVIGAFNVLEAARLVGDDPILIYTSTNKVYGGMEDVQILEKDTRYEYLNLPYGIDESRPLDFHSPYGCSKGSADQYVHDYARIYGLKTVVFRMSAIYGPHQFGMEDQAWVAYFVIALIKDWPLTIYGDGKQVRDILYINDLVRAFELATQKIQVTAGQIYNIGGGSENTISIWAEFSRILDQILGRKVHAANFREWRPGDQKIYISDIRKATQDFGWHPVIGINQGLENIARWIRDHIVIF